jgi:hypothetical protein
MASMKANHSSSVRWDVSAMKFVRPRHRSGLQQQNSGQSLGGLLEQQRQQSGNLFAHMAAINNHVDRTLLEQELGALKTLG